jgi:hypothetical protein
MIHTYNMAFILLRERRSGHPHPWSSPIDSYQQAGALANPGSCSKNRSSVLRLRMSFLSWIAVVASPFFAMAIPAQTTPPTTLEYDIVVRGGRVLDGAGNSCIFADVAIKDGRFVKLGKILGHGRTEIDAHGRYVSPGWIDMMDQSGDALPKNGLAENKLMEGVTTAIGGEGGTPVPAEQLRDFWTSLEKSGISLSSQWTNLSRFPKKAACLAKCFI